MNTKIKENQTPTSEWSIKKKLHGGNMGILNHVTSNQIINNFNF
jgi:hypothetical protein